jgi:hypothetical protein
VFIYPKYCYISILLSALVCENHSAFFWGKHQSVSKGGKGGISVSDQNIDHGKVLVACWSLDPKNNLHLMLSCPSHKPGGPSLYHCLKIAASNLIFLFFGSLQSPSQPSMGEGKTSQQDISTASTLDISDLNHLDFSTASQPDLLSVSVASTCTLDPSNVSQLDLSDVRTLESSSISQLDRSSTSQLDPSSTSHLDRSSESEAISGRPFDTSRNAVSRSLYNFDESSAIPL